MQLTPQLDQSGRILTAKNDRVIHYESVKEISDTRCGRNAA
jgi:hypothetical protein